MRAPCVMEGCEKPRRGRGLCATHWSRWRKHGDPTVVFERGVDYRVAPPCAVQDCGRKSHARGLCTKHYTRARKHGDPLAVSDLRGRPVGPSGPTWTTVHKRLNRARGPASEHVCEDCQAPAAEWSYDHTDPDQQTSNVRGSLLAFSLDLHRYQPRCVPCHRAFDTAARTA